MFRKRYVYEETQQDKSDKAKTEKSKSEKLLEMLGDLVTKRKQAKEHKKIKNLEKEIDILQNMQTFSFDVMLQEWCHDLYVTSKTYEVTKMLFLPALIPPSIAEVERTFSLIKWICTRLTQASLVHCMRISKSRTLSSKDYKDILKHWLRAEETKTKKEESNLV